MNRLEEITEYFATNTNGIRKIQNIQEDYPAYTFRFFDEYGIAIEYPINKDIAESSTSALFYTRDLIIEGVSKRFLVLVTDKEERRAKFAKWCDDAVDPGKNGENRELLLHDPLEWWNSWTDMLGDKKSNRQSYSTIAEMIVLDHLYQKDRSVVWAADHAGSHDIESDSESFEVKSTIKKSDTSIKISSQHQLSHTKPLSLYFCRMELSKTGLSINDMRDILVGHGYDAAKLDDQLTAFGFMRGASIRNIKYKVLEKRKYVIDDSFPKLTPDSFKDGVIPPSITKIEYTIDLNGIEFTTW